jgi:hypothetical protein
MVPAKCKYADSETNAYLRGNWYQTVMLAYLRYVSTRFIAPGTLYYMLPHFTLRLQGLTILYIVKLQSLVAKCCKIRPQGRRGLGVCDARQPPIILNIKKLVKMFCCWSKEILRVNALTFEEIHRLSSILKFGQILFLVKIY